MHLPRKPADLTKLVRDETALDDAVHRGVVDALHVLDAHFGKHVIGDEIAHALDNLVKASIRNKMSKSASPVLRR